MIRAIAPVLRLWATAYYEWALSEINPLHDDVPFIVHRLNALRELQR